MPVIRNGKIIETLHLGNTNAVERGAVGLNNRLANLRVSRWGREKTNRKVKRTSASSSSLRESSQPCLSPLIKDTLGQAVADLTGRSAVHRKSMFADPFGRDPHQEGIEENCQ
jgi:hypothetical protein